MSCTPLLGRHVVHSAPAGVMSSEVETYESNHDSFLQNRPCIPRDKFLLNFKLIKLDLKPETSPS